MEHTVTLIVGQNGSIEVINEDEIKVLGELSTLGIFLIFSVLLNMILVGAGLLRKPKDTINITPLIIALSVTNVIDSIVNHTLGLLLLAFWPDSCPPEFICRLSAASYIALLLLQPLYVLALLLQVLVQNQMSSTILPHCFLVAPPIIAGLLSTPVVFLSHLIQVRHFISRHLCGIAGENLVYSVGLITVGFFSSWAAIGYGLVARRCSCYGSGHQCCGEDKDFRSVVTLVLLTIILVLPAVTSFSVISMTPLANLSTYGYNENDIVIITGKHDTIITWIRFSFDIFTPIVVLIFFKDLRLECYHMLIFIRSSSANTSYSNESLRQSKNTSSQGGPILFVTFRGLMLLRDSKDGHLPIDKCDFLEPDQQVSNSLSINQQTSSSSSSSIKTRKKSDNCKRKIVRFAQSIKEIPNFLDD